LSSLHGEEDLKTDMVDVDEAINESGLFATEMPALY